VTVITSLLLLNSAIAAEDFSIDSSKIVSLCPCSGQTYTVSISNTGDEISAYRVFSSQDNPYDWASPYNAEFTLKPSERTSIPIIVDSQCNVQGGTNFEFIVATTNGLVKKFSQAYLFNQCYNQSIQQGQLSKDPITSESEFTEFTEDYSICPGDNYNIPLKFNNLDEQAKNVYNLGLSAPSWVKLDINQFALEPKQSGILSLRLTPSQELTGSYPLELTSTSKVGDVTEKVEFNIELQRCHLVDIKLPVIENNICSGDESEATITIINNGENTEELELQLQGPEWATLSKQSTTINSESQEDITLDLKPENASGTYNIEFSASSDSIDSSGFIQVNIDPETVCKSTEIQVPSRISLGFGTEFIPVKIYNNGLKESDYDISVSGQDWISVEPDNLELEPGKTWNVNIKSEPSEDIGEGSYPITLTLTTSGTEFTHDITLTLKQQDSITSALNFISYYKYYFYLGLILLLITLANLAIFRFKVINKIKESNKKRQIKKARLEALQKAREARKKKREEESDSK
tara:strand:+ start:29701 stop:31263 length:1563 start_codon:yes stop_codon:yes gene_type:complete